MIQGTQDMLIEAGKYACYYLCLCYLAKDEFRSDDVETLQEKGLLKDDFTVMNAGEILSYLTGTKYVHSKENVDYVVQSGDLLIGEFKLDWMNHFVVIDKDKKVVFNPLTYSKCVDKGKLSSIRVLRRVV